MISNPMKVTVWDTYVTKKRKYHYYFNILAPDEISNLETIYAFGKDYLKSKNEEDSHLTTKECNFCHIEKQQKNRYQRRRKRIFHNRNGRMLSNCTIEPQSFTSNILGVKL